MGGGPREEEQAAAEEHRPPSFNCFFDLKTDCFASGVAFFRSVFVSSNQQEVREDLGERSKRRSEEKREEERSEEKRFEKKRKNDQVFFRAINTFLKSPFFY